ncbi:MAG: ABC transporter ATP-binding protein [Candidatus Adiutrix sp.]
MSIIFKNVKRYFGPHLVLNDLSFELKSGGRYALLGPNGAGKSTLMRILARRLHPDSGEVLWLGDPKESNRSVAFLSEGDPLAPELTVSEHIYLAGKLCGLTAAAISKRQKFLTDGLNLGSFITRPTRCLSQGQRRRAALAAIMLVNPTVLILDEPTGGLDPDETLRLAQFLSALPSSVTILISSHILSEIVNMTSHVLILNQGSLVSFAPWGQVLPAAENRISGRQITQLTSQYLAQVGPKEVL